MNRVDMQQGSRIPRFSGQRSMVSQNFQQEPMPGVSAQKPSKLQMMQQEYQRSMMKEKEDKLINMYESNQQKALQRVNKRGSVREFFQERRTMGPVDHNTPTMHQLYNQKKSGSQLSGFSNNNSARSNGRAPSTNKPQPINPNNSAGRDRSKLLAPIQRNGAQNNMPFPQKPQIVRPKTYTGRAAQQNKENFGNRFIPKSAPNGENMEYNQNRYDDDEEDETPPPNAQQLYQLQQKRKMLQVQRNSNKNLMQNKQVKQRQPPSRNKIEYEPSDEDEGFDDNGANGADEEIKRKQQELLAQIERQQQELNNLRNERQMAEQQEAIEREKRKKFEEERRRRQVEEERRRKLAEEEERIREQQEQEEMEHKQREQAEHRRRLEAEKQRMRKTPASSHAREYEDYNQYEDEYDHHEPTPPPQPRPANIRKSVPAKRPPPKQNNPSPDFISGGADVSLYEQAIQQEGAFESLGKLKACYNCGRKFAVDRLEKHEKACKNVTKKRKVLDSSKLRTRGTEMEQYVARAGKKRAVEKPKSKNWRQQHESFIEAIRYAKKVTQIEKEGGNVADLPPPPRLENPDYVQCPHCTRKFNVSAAERHIPHCANTRAKPPPRRR
ncbi:ZC21C-like protein [Mya arenaria]|uniref:ZC21C-like protein n=1 Tax=Mya arenaria TaxID=6604 RepID=A0ABY7F9K9_MYAAR|nr:zinc finger C2HC domain-containing protein 1C-like [Mya arenaria]WAR18287.1 ZC21C-like protein [Mya arenaria]